MAGGDFQQAVAALISRFNATIGSDLGNVDREQDGRPEHKGAQLIFMRRLPEMRGTPEYQAALQSLTTDPAFSRVANSYVTSAVWGGSITGHDVLDGLLWRLIASGRLDTAEAEVRRLVAAAQEPLYARWMAPVFNLQLAIDELPITESLTFVRLRQLDVDRLERTGALSSGPAYTRPAAGQLFAISSSFDVPRHFAGEAIPEDEIFGFRRFSDDRVSAAAAVLEALRLFRPQHVWIPAVLFWTEDPLQGHEFVTTTSAFPSRARAPAPIPMDYALSVDDAKAFVEFYIACKRARHASNSLGLALRRFSDASDRYRDDDRLIDLMIACEALLLGGSETTELSYRAALRGAVFTADAPAERRDIFDHLRVAYALRSKIVHGSTITKKDLRPAGGVEFPEFVASTEGLLRGALRKAIVQAATDGSFKPDWEAMVLGMLGPASGTRDP